MLNAYNTFSDERVHKRYTSGRRAITDKLDAEQAGQCADLAVGAALPCAIYFQIRYYMFNLAYLPLCMTSTAITVSVMKR